MAKTKATSTLNYGFAQIDCAQDPNMLFQDYVKKDSKENWKKADSVIKAIDDRVTQLENEPSSNVLLGEEEQDKFNFAKNDNKAIGKLEVTKDDTTTSYNFATTENHVEMSTGRTLHDEYMGVLKTMGKEFESPDGSDIAVENGLEARVISGEISGRTVKSVLGNVFAVGGGVTKIDDTWYKCVNTDRYYIDLISYERLPIKENTKYTCFVEFRNVKIEEKNNNLLYLGLSNDGGVFANELTYSNGTNCIEIKDGIHSFSFTSSKNHSNGLSIRILRGNTPNTSEKSCEFRLLGVVEGDDGEVKNIIKLGLTSTQGIIENNGQEYEFYEPTIQGKTKILNGEGQEVQVGANGAKLVSLKPNDNAPYELGSTLNISDTIDIENKILTVNTIEIELDGTEDWKFYDVTPESHRQMYVQPIENLAIYNDSSINCLSNHFKSCAFKDRENLNTLNHIFVSRNLIAVMREKTETVEQWKQYLAQQKASDNPVKVRYQLETAINIQLTDEQFKQYESYKKVILLLSQEDRLLLNNDGTAQYIKNFKYNDDNTDVERLPSPVTTQIPKELVPAILTHDSNKISVGGTVTPTNYKVTLPVDKLSDFEKRLQALESTTVDVILNK